VSLPRRSRGGQGRADATAAAVAAATAVTAAANDASATAAAAPATPTRAPASAAGAAISLRTKGVAFALLSAAGFSTLGLFAKLIYSEGMSLPQALAWRFSVAALLLWIGVALTKRPGGGKRLLVVALLGVFGFAPQAGLYFLTVKILNPGITSLLLYLYPSFVLLLSIVFLRKRPNHIQLLSLALSLAGCAITLFRPGAYPIVGLAIGAVMALVYGAYLVVAERLLVNIDHIWATAVLMTSAACVYWIMTIASGPVVMPTHMREVVGILGAGIISSVLAVTLLFAAISRIGAADTSLLSTLEPVLTILLSGIFLGERLGTPQAVGGLLILSAVVVLHFEPRPRVS
jgi:drug/metabolite transporter (DMT)-like permease